MPPSKCPELGIFIGIRGNKDALQVLLIQSEGVGSAFPGLIYRHSFAEEYLHYKEIYAYIFMYNKEALIFMIAPIIFVGERFTDR